MIVKVKESGVDDQTVWHYFETESFSSHSHPRAVVESEWREYELYAPTPADQRVENDCSHMAVISLSKVGEEKRKLIAAEIGSIFVMSDEGKTVERI